MEVFPLFTLGNSIQYKGFVIYAYIVEYMYVSIARLLYQLSHSMKGHGYYAS